jgi:hypothetical protein
VRTVEGHGQSFVTLQRVLGKPTPQFSFLGKWRFLGKRLIIRLFKLGIRAGVIEWFWEYGFVRESQKKAKVDITKA